MQTVVERPAQSDLACFAGDEFSDDRAMTRGLYINGHIGLVFNMDGFSAVLGLNPPFGRLICALRVQILDIDIGHSWADVSEAPGDALVVADNHEWESGKSDSNNVKCA